jgi:hypothetical protein
MGLSGELVVNFADAPLLAQGQVIVTPAGEIHGSNTPESRELARRIQACINACAGLSTEELERGIIADMTRVIGLVTPLLQRARQDAA